MTIAEIQDHIHVYSMFRFSDGRREAGILINKFNLTDFTVEYHFVPQHEMHVYKKAFDTYDPETCRRVSRKVDPSDILSVSTVSLSDYRMIMQLMHEREAYLNMNRH